MRIAERRRRSDCAACAVEAVDALALRRGASDRAAVRRVRCARPRAATASATARASACRVLHHRRLESRSSNSPCCRCRAASTRPLSRSWLHTFRWFTTPRSLFDCLSASTRWRRSTRASAARSATRSCHARAPRSATCSTRGCGTYASDFLARQRAVCRCWWQCADVCRLVRGLTASACRRARRRCRVTASGVRGVDQENAQVTAATSSIRRAVRSRLPPSRGRAADGAGGGAPTFVLVRAS
jgi:hypothetical protein